MKKLLILASFFFSLNTYAQFIEEKAPTETELKINNANKIGELLKLAHAAKAKKDHANLISTLKKVVALKPYTPIFRYQLAEAYALNDNKTEAFNELITIQKQGFYFDLGSNTHLANINTYPVFKYIKENMEANNVHFGEGVEAFNIDQSFSGLLFESLAFDPSSPAFLMGSLRDGRIIKILDSGKITELISASEGKKTGPWATIDMAVDAKNDTLWVASASISQFGKFNKESTGKSAVFKYQLSTGNLLSSYLVPGNKGPSMIHSITVTEKGDVYFVDSVQNVVLRIAKDSEQISLAFTSKKYKNLRNVTSDETGDILYLSDADEGIIILNLLKQEIYNLPNAETLNLTGITDLIYDNNGLIIFQNEFQPERIMRLALNKSKFVIENIFPIESGNPLFNSLSKGAIVDQGLYYIANSQSTKTNAFGGLLKGKEWESMLILSSPKHYKEQETLDYNKQIEAQKQKTGSR
ncbi:MAG: hypothetical protein L3J83_09165 [Proteobacteria bacterium]|nr:hypothetical protein [Pseudomonadota bacterium]